MKTFKEWMTDATPEAKAVLAAAAGTSVASLRQMAHGYRTNGYVRLTPEMARKIELASNGQFRREHLCPACGRCELAAKARSRA